MITSTATQISSKIQNMATVRLSQIQRVLAGKTPARYDRWHNSSFTNISRAVKFISNLSKGEFNIRRYEDLYHNIPNFSTILGTNLSRALGNLF